MATEEHPGSVWPPPQDSIRDWTARWHWIFPKITLNQELSWQKKYPKKAVIFTNCQHRIEWKKKQSNLVVVSVVAGLTGFVSGSVHMCASLKLPPTLSLLLHLGLALITSIGARDPLLPSLQRPWEKERQSLLYIGTTMVCCFPRFDVETCFEKGWISKHCWRRMTGWLYLVISFTLLPLLAPTSSSPYFCCLSINNSQQFWL